MTPDTIPTAIERAHMIAMLAWSTEALALVGSLLVWVVIDHIWRKR